MSHIRTLHFHRRPTAAESSLWTYHRLGKCCRLNSFRASAICFAVAPLGNTVKIILDLVSVVAVFDVVTGVSPVAGISGGLSVLMPQPYCDGPGNHQRIAPPCSIRLCT